MGRMGTKSVRKWVSVLKELAGRVGMEPMENSQDRTRIGTYVTIRQDVRSGVQARPR